MKRVSMSGSPRENVGKKDAKAQRKAGNVVCVLYGGEEQISFTLPEKKFDKIIFTPEVYLVDLEIGEKKYTVLLKEVQYHPVSERVLHADFLQIMENKAISVGIPIKITGTSPGVIAGGRLTLKMRKINLKGLVNDIPENIVLNIDKLKIGDSIRVKDVSIEGITLIDNPSNVILSVKTARGVAGVDGDEEAEDTEAAGATTEDSAEKAAE